MPGPGKSGSTGFWFFSQTTTGGNGGSLCILQDRVKGWLVSAVELDGLSTKLLRQPETREKERIIAIQYNNISTVVYHEQELMPQEVKTSLMDYLVIDKFIF